jgi:P27 family predicted phage terminase small subunit
MARPKKPRGPEAAAPGGVPEKPTDLSQAASVEWDLLIGELSELGTISTVDRATIEMAARYCGYFHEAAEDVQKNGLMLNTKTGVKSNPSIRSRDDAARIRKSYLEALGLTPGSRSRVSQPAELDRPTLADILEGRADGNGFFDEADKKKKTG